MGDLVDFPLTRDQTDTVEALQDLLAEAESGRINGFAYITRAAGTDYSIGAAGSAMRCPDATQQLLMLLYVELSKITRTRQHP